MLLLSQFIFRLSFGLALAMACTPARWVTSGYYRVHLYVVLGLNALAAAVAWSAPEPFAVVPPIAAAVLAYVGSVLWLYERPRAGVAALAMVSAAALWGAWTVRPAEQRLGDASAVLITARTALGWLDPVGGGLLLGTTLAAMLLGHWYLNNPGMPLAPLKRLIALMAGATALRVALCGVGLVCASAAADAVLAAHWPLIVLRWLSGLLGAGVIALMAWQTLKIPNTQSATGILYVGVILTFLGELSAQLLSAGGRIPL